LAGYKGKRNKRGSRYGLLQKYGVAQRDCSAGMDKRAVIKNARRDTRARESRERLNRNDHVVTPFIRAAMLITRERDVRKMPNKAATKPAEAEWSVAQSGRPL